MTVADKAKQALAKTTNGNGDTKKEIVPIPQTLTGMKTTDINKVFDLYSLQIAQMVPKHLSPERVLKVFATYVRRNPGIAACTTESVMGALMQCAELGFMPSPALQQIYFTPRKNRNNNNRLELEFGLQYQGKLDLMYRSGKISNVRTRVVYEKDDFEVIYGDEEKINHKPTLTGERGNPVGVYCIITLTDGQVFREFMTRDEVYHVRNASDAYRGEKNKPENQRYGPWFKHEAEMWRKTVLNRASKYVPKSIEMMKSDFADGQVLQPGEVGDLDKLALLEEPEQALFNDVTDIDDTDTPEENDEQGEDNAAEHDEPTTVPDPMFKPASNIHMKQIQNYAKQLKKDELDPQTSNELSEFLAKDKPSYDEAKEWVDFFENREGNK